MGNSFETGPQNTETASFGGLFINVDLGVCTGSAEQVERFSLHFGGNGLI